MFVNDHENITIDYYIKRYKVIDKKVATTVMFTEAWFTIHANCTI